MRRDDRPIELVTLDGADARSLDEPPEPALAALPPLPAVLVEPVPPPRLPPPERAPSTAPPPSPPDDALASGSIPPADAPRDGAPHALLAPVHGALRAGALLATLPLSLLPEAWRRRLGGEHLPYVAASVVTGMGECALALVGGGFGYDRYRHIADRALEAYTRAILETGGNPAAGAFGLGATTFLGFLVSPVGLLCLYVFFEGMLRALAAGFAGEACGTLPLYLADELRHLAVARLARRREPPLVADDLRRDGDALVIASCRRRDWDGLTTISVDGALYRYAGALPDAAGPRPFVHRLEPIPDSHIVRRLVHYAPDELLPPAAR